MQEAEGYRTRIVQTAEGDASRFRQMLTEYQKAPAVTRDRMYLDTMQQVFSNTTKVLVDSRNSNQLLYLPFDKLMQQVTQDALAQRTPPAAIRPRPNPRRPPTTRGRGIRCAVATARRVEPRMNRILATIVGLVITAFIIRASTFIVDQRQSAIVYQLGQITRVVTEPGLYFRIPLLQNVSTRTDES